MPSEPFSVTLGASNHSLVRGCPGVPKTCPRVESVLEIRSKDGTSFAINNVTLELNTIQSVSIPATAGLSSNDVHRAYNIHKDQIYRPKNDGVEPILAMDLPFIIPLKKDIMSSGKNSRWNAKTIHNLTVRIGWWSKTNNNTNTLNNNNNNTNNNFSNNNNHSKKLEMLSVSFPLIIKRYDTLPLYRQFNEPITKTVDSLDKNILVEYSLPNTSVGPKDELILYMKISPNSNFLNNNSNLDSSNSRFSFMKRKPPIFKLKKIQFELREILVCHETGLSSKQTKLLSKQQDFDTELGADGITTQISFDFPSEIKNIISNSSSNAINSTKKLPLSALNTSGNNILSNPNSIKLPRSSIDGYRPQLSKRLFLPSSSTNKRKSLDLKNLNNVPDFNNNRNLFSLNLDKSLIEEEPEDEIEAIKPVPTIQSFGLNNNHKTLTTNTKLLEEVNTGIPLTHMQGFTSNGKLFSIKYELVFRIKIHNSNSGSNKSSVKFSQPITVSPYDRIQSVKLLKWIIKEWELAQFINNTTFKTTFNNEKINYINSITTATIPTTTDGEFDEGNVTEDYYEDMDETTKFINDSGINTPLNKSENNFFSVSNNISKHHHNNRQYPNNHYYDYSIGALRDSEFEKQRLNYREIKSKKRVSSYGSDHDDPYALTIYQTKPFHIYRPQNQMDWKLLGLSEKALGASGKSIVHYID